MTELKTLKDIEKEIQIYLKKIGWEVKTDRDLQSTIPFNVLKQEAVKWIKYFKQIEPVLLLHAEQIEVDNGIKNWIKHFFNLTDGDLK